MKHRRGDGPFLHRLWRNRAGNTLMLAAAALIPLLAMIGGALDMSRTYLIKARLQHACDAAVLAGRRSISDRWTEEAENRANHFFRANFVSGRYGSENPTISFSIDSDLVVHGVARAQVPMAVMKIFGKDQIDLEVDCDAELQLPNSDIMFVLDTTYSMYDTNPGDSQNRITILKEAVKNFYDTLEAARASGTSVRYGFVPYANTVNVGMLLKREWVTDAWVYQSREQWGPPELRDGGTQGSTITTTTTTPPNDVFTTNITYGSYENCVAPANKNWTDTYSAWSAWSSPTLPRSRTRTRTRNGSTFTASRSNGRCVITEKIYNNFVQTQEQTEKQNPNAGKENADSWVYYWNYKPISYDLAALKGNLGSGRMAGGSFSVNIGDNYTSRTILWNATNACIEERGTRRTNEGTGIPMLDMDIDTPPTPGVPETQWRPYLPGLVYGRNNTSFTATSGWKGPTQETLKTSANYLTPSSSSNEYGACPVAARALGTITKSDLTSYVNSLTPRGFTYHDIGFLWGLRLLSPTLFPTENALPANGSAPARHLIFMTDGETDTRIGAYDAWGISAIDRRRTDAATIPTNADQNRITEERLSALCEIAKTQKHVTVWVIAFGTDLTPLLSSCASPNRAFQADNASELAATFAEIAAQISQLRLTR